MTVSRAIIDDIPPRLGSGLKEYEAGVRDYVLSDDYQLDVREYIASSKRPTMSFIRGRVERVRENLGAALRGLLLTDTIAKDVLALGVEAKSHYKYLVSLYGSAYLLDQVSAMVDKSILPEDAERWAFLEQRRCQPTRGILYVYRRAGAPKVPAQSSYDVVVEIEVNDDLRPLSLVYAMDRFLIGLTCIEQGLLAAEFDYMRQKSLEIHGPSFETIGFSLADISLEETHEMHEAELSLLWVKEKLKEIEPLHQRVVEMSYAIFEGVSDWFRRFDIALRMSNSTS